MINRVVPVIITADFHAAKDISSDFVVLKEVADMFGKHYWIDINLLCTILADNGSKIIHGGGWTLVYSSIAGRSNCNLEAKLATGEKKERRTIQVVVY